MPFGSEAALSSDLTFLERLYIRLLGIPILGLRIRARSILPFLNEIESPKRIVDAGSGRGMMSFAAARRFPQAEIIGVDLNEEQNKINNEIASKLGLENVRFETHDALQLAVYGKFDLVISCDSLEHLVDDNAGVRMFHEVLNQGGCLLIHVPHITRNLFGWRRENWMDVEGHVRPGYSRQGLIKILSDGGLVVRKCTYNYNSFETLANDCSKLITRAREDNRLLYALFFPVLLAISWLGAFCKPVADGSGLIALAHREE